MKWKKNIYKFRRHRRQRRRHLFATNEKQNENKIWYASACKRFSRIKPKKHAHKQTESETDFFFFGEKQ